MVLAALIAFGKLRHHAEAWLAFAVGSLVAAALLGMIPEALEGGLAPDALGAWLLLGLWLFFLLEKYARRGQQRDTPLPAAVPMVILGDGLHNFVDGVLIAAAYLADPHLGIATALAVTLHEIPQELGDFMVLLAAGLSRSRALVLNLLSGFATLAGGLAGYLVLDGARAALPAVLTVAAASFLYIAISNLIPLLHGRIGLRAGLAQSILMAIGGSAVFLGHAFSHAH